MDPNSVGLSDKAEHVTHLVLKNQIHAQTCNAILYEIEQHDDFEFPWDFPDDKFTDTIRISPITT